MFHVRSKMISAVLCTAAAAVFIIFILKSDMGILDWNGSARPSNESRETVIRSKTETQPAGGRNSTEEEAVKKVITDAYINGFLIEGDSQAMRKGIHEDCQFIGYAHTGTVVRPLGYWLKKIDENPPVPPGAVDYNFKFVSVTGYAAAAEVEIDLGNKFSHTGFFLLYKFKDGWQIISRSSWYPDYKYPVVRTPASIDTGTYADYTGYYRVNGGLDFTVTSENNRLFGQYGDMEPVELLPESKNRFYTEVTAGTVEFVRDDRGKVIKLIMKQDDDEVEAHKLEPKVAVFSGPETLFEIREVIDGPFASKGELLEKYGTRIDEDVIILERHPGGNKNGYYALSKETVIDAGDLESVDRSTWMNGAECIEFTADQEGAKKLERFTSQNIGKRAAIIINQKVTSAPIIRGTLSKKGIITGEFTEKEINELVLQLRLSILKNREEVK